MGLDYVETYRLIHLVRRTAEDTGARPKPAFSTGVAPNSMNDPYYFDGKTLSHSA
jgi:hypothetical protein